MATKFVIATFDIDPGKQAKVMDVLLACREQTLPEPGCLEFDVLRSVSDPRKVVVIEAFREPQDHDTHIDTPYVRAVVAAVNQHATSRTYQNIYTERVAVDHGD